MYKIEFTLKQHTPIIHFQHDQEGATLRATEVKPKLDRFIIERLTNQTGDAAFTAFKANPEWKKWLVGNGVHPALDYKLKISIDDIEPIESRLSFFEDDNEVDIQKKWKMKGNYPMLLANMGGKPTKNELKDLIHYDSLESTIVCYNDSLRDCIANNLCQFFATINFGNRNNKGFGSFSVIKLDGKNIPWSDNYLPKHTFYLQFGTKEVRKTFEVIDYFYKWLKSGINYTSYRDKDRNFRCDNNRYKKSLLFEYLNLPNQSNSNNYSWEKRWLKEGYFTLTPVQNNPKFARALLGLSDKNIFTRPKCNAKGSDVPVDQSNKTIFNAHSNLEIERIKSPILFKPVFSENEVKVYILIDNKHIIDLYNNNISKAFLFSEIEKFEISYSINGNRYKINYRLGERLSVFDEHLERLNSHTGNGESDDKRREIEKFLKNIKSLPIPNKIIDYPALLNYVKQTYKYFDAKNYLWFNIVNSPVLIKQT